MGRGPDNPKVNPVGVDHADPGSDKTVGAITQWNGGWSIIGEVPASAGKLVASTVFAGLLILAFERGVYVVRDGKLEPISFAPVAPIGG
jgi:hypothetical protein